MRVGEVQRRIPTSAVGELGQDLLRHDGVGLELLDLRGRESDAEDRGFIEETVGGESSALAGPDRDRHVVDNRGAIQRVLPYVHQDGRSIDVEADASRQTASVVGGGQKMPGAVVHRDVGRDANRSVGRAVDLNRKAP